MFLETVTHTCLEGTAIGGVLSGCVVSIDVTLLCTDLQILSMASVLEKSDVPPFIYHLGVLQ